MTSAARHILSATLATTVAATAPSASPAGAAPQVRGTWVTTTNYATGNVATPAVTASNFKLLREAGLNSVYMDAWRDGATWYPSTTFQSINGSAQHSALAGRDLLQDTVIQAHRNGMANVAWFQYGFATVFQNGGNALTTYMKNKGWLLKDNGGGYYGQSNNFQWMNPAVPEVRQFMVGIVTDAVRKYDLDGVQFDDRLAWPVNYGFDDTTKSLYLAETGRPLPAAGSDPQFLAWRAGKVTQFAKELSAAVKAINPNCIVSVAPTPYPTGYNSYAADWPEWSRTNVTVNGQSVPMVDEIIPQIYSSTTSYFNNEWARQQSNIAPARRNTLGVGIAITTNGVTNNWATVTRPQLDTAQASTGTAGHVWWYSADVLARDYQQIKDYYDVAANGQADRPDRPSGYFAPSLAASAAGAGQWQVGVTTPAQYSVITNVNGVWSIVETRLFPAGASIVPVAPSAGSVELILDHRPASLFNESAWNVDADGLASSGANWSHGAVPGGAGYALKFSYVPTAPRTITLDTSLAAGSVTFSNPNAFTLSGSAPLTLAATSGSAQLSVTAGHHTIDAPLVLASPTALALSAGTSLKLSGAVSGTLSSLSLAPGATLDVTINDLVIDYAATSPFNTLKLATATAFQDGRWTGTGLTSSAAAGQPHHATALAIADNATARLSQFAGQDVDLSAVLIKYTWYGDANLDGVVNRLDLDQVDAARTRAGTKTWSDGDFNYDGAVDADDFALFSLGASSQDGSLAAVPEPSTGLLLTLLLLPTYRRHRPR